MAGDYTNKITASVTAKDSGTGASLSDSEQTGLTVLSPASLTVSSTLSGSTYIVGINNIGDVSTTYNVSINCPSGLTCTASTFTSGTISGKSLVEVRYSLSTTTTGSYVVSATVLGGNGQILEAPSRTYSYTAPSAGAAAPSEVGVTLNITAGKVTKTYSSITPFTPKTITSADLEASGTHLTEIYISVKNRVTNVEITIEKLPKQPAEITINVTGLVYKWISITKKNLEDENIEKAKIRFKVEKSWITDNNINSTTLALYRWHANKWNKLPTQKISEDSNFIYFEAETPGFSYFAISGEKIVAASLAPVCGNGICETGESYTNCPQDCPAPTPTCTCTDWYNVGCGISPCKQNEMKQTRTCTPSKCDLEERCIEDSKCIPSRLPTWVIAIAVIVIIILILFVLYKKNLMKM
jgi:PGF-pre-PGF domain-containing protein